ncbi:MAG: MFS transporter [Actinomycetota bacterium]|nr:MFS transporter [Actinomycetota bacterium]
MSAGDREEAAYTGSIAYAHRGAFWVGITAVSTGVLLHLPSYVSSRDMGYRMVGMRIDGTMMVGMALIVAGIGATAYGLFPRRSDLAGGAVARIRVQALDEAAIKPAHVGLLLVMAAAVTIDVMKPTTLAFVVPGAAQEYGLKSPLNPGGSVPVALLPLAGIGGTVIGSFVWGWLGDRLGRRASILLAGVLFIATSVCGSMPAFGWNVLMCFVMGLGVGGMLPITFALMAETIPARHRSWLMVLIGGDVAGAYVITSWLASWLEPEFGWRILWLLGLPTGVLLVLLNRWIPESPRFLLAAGRQEDAERVMRRFGATIVEEEGGELSAEEEVPSRFGQLLRRPLGGLTVSVCLFGLAYGLVNFGFVLWLPTNLRELGYAVVTSDQLLRDSALIGFPATFVVAYLYGFWSSKKTMVLLAVLTCATLSAFVVMGEDSAQSEIVLKALIVLVLIGSSSVLAVLTPYSSEVYPTRIRSRGTGLAAGASKIGGVLGIGLVAASVAPPDLVGSALLGAVATLLSAAAIAVFGIETRRRRLEEIAMESLVGHGRRDPRG